MSSQGLLYHRIRVFGVFFDGVSGGKVQGDNSDFDESKINHGGLFLWHTWLPDKAIALAWKNPWLGVT